MKTEKEIEKIARKFYISANESVIDGFIDGYTKAQSKKSTLKGLCKSDDKLRKEVIRLCSKAWLKTPNDPNMLKNFDNWIKQNI